MIDCVPKIIGADVELGNYLRGGGRLSPTGHLASRLLLEQIQGVSGWSYKGYQTIYPQDIGRKWLSNGGAAYIDLDHLEICIPEVTCAWDFCAAFHAQLRIAREARDRAAADLRPGETLHVAACNSDGQGASWGSHLNFLISRACFDNIFKKRLQYLLWLASYQAASVVLHGQGKVGSENFAPEVPFQLSQRADFMEQIVALQTTFNRPLINARDENLTGSEDRFARFHHIACDVNLAHTANVLKAGILQILLCMVEAEAPQVGTEPILRDPVQACGAFSRDPNLEARQPMLSGEARSAVDVVRSYFDVAAEFVASGACDLAVPRAREIIRLWGETLDLLAERDWGRLARRLDWVLKYQMLQEVLDENPGLTWQSPEIKHLDLEYGSLNRQEGIYWQLEEAGFVDRLVSDRQIERLITNPPLDTRAFTRGKLLQAFEPRQILEIDWDRLKVEARTERSSTSYSRSVAMGDPTGHTRSQTGRLFRQLAEGRLQRDEVLKRIAPELVATPAFGGYGYGYGWSKAPTA
jgi:proteasome accessory factor A